MPVHTQNELTKLTNIYILGWTLLHTIAAYYPDNPTDEDKLKNLNFIKSFSQVFPCNYCAKDFQEIIRDYPPDLNNRYHFSQWMCMAHNMVNEKLGKPFFDCSLIDKRWRRKIKKPTFE